MKYPPMRSNTVLSKGECRIDVRWRAERQNEDRALTPDWTESDGTAVAAPSRARFGSKLLQRDIGAQGDAPIACRRGGCNGRIEAVL